MVTRTQMFAEMSIVVLFYKYNWKLSVREVSVLENSWYFWPYLWYNYIQVNMYRPTVGLQ